MEEVEALSIACRKPLVPCSLHLEELDGRRALQRHDVLKE